MHEVQLLTSASALWCPSSSHPSCVLDVLPAGLVAHGYHTAEVCLSLEPWLPRFNALEHSPQQLLAYLTDWVWICCYMSETVEVIDAHLCASV
jgi:hypothetical protein